MYNHFQLARKYLRYFLSASNGKGHGVHSPFVFDLIKNVLNDKTQFDCYRKIENERTKLKASSEIIEVDDFGAGSAMIATKLRKVKDIAGSSLKPKKYAQLLFRLVHYYKPATIVELGTSLGITSAYLASGNKDAKLYTCEGAPGIAARASATFNSLQLTNVELIEGDFTITLPSLIAQVKQVDFVFIDGNHRNEPTLNYFKQFLTRSTTSTIFVFDDIHWSREMEAAWADIQLNPAVTLTVDLFFIGLVFINPDFKVRQHFTIRF